MTAQQLATAFKTASGDAKADAMAELEKGTNQIKDLSVKNSPVDDGELEDGHKVTKRRNGSDKVTFDVTVGGMVRGVNVDAYATRLHESSYNLGPKSKLKDAGQAERVGPKFLERAYDKLIDGIIDRVFGAVTKRMDNAG